MLSSSEMGAGGYGFDRVACEKELELALPACAKGREGNWIDSSAFMLFHIREPLSGIFPCPEICGF